MRDFEDPKWLNASVSLDSAKAQVDEYIERFTADVKAVESIDCDAATMVALKGCFKRTHSVSEVLQMKNRIDAEKARREAEKATQGKQLVHHCGREKPDVLIETPMPALLCLQLPKVKLRSLKRLKTEPTMEIGKVTHTPGFDWHPRTVCIASPSS